MPMDNLIMSPVSSRSSGATKSFVHKRRIDRIRQRATYTLELDQCAESEDLGSIPVWLQLLEEIVLKLRGCEPAGIVPCPGDEIVPSPTHLTDISSGSLVGCTGNRLQHQWWTSLQHVQCHIFIVPVPEQAMDEMHRTLCPEKTDEGRGRRRHQGTYGDCVLQEEQVGCNWYSASQSKPCYHAF
jgi:hypothetical protein